MSGEVEITGRQLTFLRAVTDLVVEARSPVHYTDVAERLGVNRYSAYDMLRVLDGKGLVATDYVVGASGTGPGRSRVVFYPTRLGIAVLRREGADASILRAVDKDSASGQGQEDWNDFRQSILRRLQDARNTGSRELLHDLLSRLPERRRPLHYCAQMIGALVLNLERVRGRMAAISPFEALATLTADEDGGIRALVGLSLGSALMADDRTDPAVGQQLVSHIQGFQRNLDSLSGDSQSRLRSFLWEAVRAIEPLAVPSGSSQGEVRGT